MVTLRAGLADFDERVLVCFFDLAGCSFDAPSRQSAEDLAPIVAGEHIAWLARHGLGGPAEDVIIEVVEELDVGNSDAADGEFCFQDDLRRVANAYLRGIALVAMITIPGSVVAVILAPEAIHVLLGGGHKWDDVIVPFQIFAAGLIFRTSYKISDSLARAMGTVYKRAWRQAVYAAAVVIGWGLLTLARFEEAVEAESEQVSVGREVG